MTRNVTLASDVPNDESCISDTQKQEHANKGRKYVCKTHRCSFSGSTVPFLGFFSVFIFMQRATSRHKIIQGQNY